MNLKIIFVSLTILLSACGGGGSSSGGSSGDLGRCDFTLGNNGAPQVAIAITTEDKAVGDAIRTECEQARVQTSKAISCFSIPTTAEMYPSVVRTKNNGYTMLIKNVNQTNIAPVEIPRAVADQVVGEWMLANGITSFISCGA